MIVYLLRFLILSVLFSSTIKVYGQDWNHYTGSTNIGKYEKFELIIRADFQDVRQYVIVEGDNPNNPNKLNPFNPDYINENGISLEAIFTSPDGKEHKVYGFYMEDWNYNMKHPWQ
ncbi:MAG: hypothetical protein U9R19_08340 [Bacteroidota bacterium]|nr:hypothetical protein [Bacteroidota bacterium]